MKKVLFIPGLILCLGVFAQETAKQAVIDIEQHVYHKKFNKKWEKTMQSDWEKSVKEASGIADLNKLFNEYSDLLAQTASFSMGNSDASTEVEFIQYMLDVEGTISEDFAEDWSLGDRMKWREELESFLAKEQEKKKKADQMARFQKMNQMVKGFSADFPKVWEDSKKNAFANTSDMSFKGAQNTEVIKDEYGVASLVVLFDTEGDEPMAKKLLEELVAVIKQNVEEGYKQGNDMQPEYVGSMRKEFQFEGEKFSETAKKPTVSIGVLKDTPGVKVIITEPVFGH